MNEQSNTTLIQESASIMERIAQSLMVAYAWVSGPAMTEQERISEELARANRLEVKLDTTSIVK